MIVKTGYISTITHEIRNSGTTTSHRNYKKGQRTYHLLKRSFDLLISALVIATVLSWLLPILALLIKWESRGPVFFLQRRIGRGGKAFTCYKLRTMVVNAEADTRPAAEDDERITRMGLFLRRSNLDEVPQFFNVLSGTMSLVGPRPYMLSDCRAFSELIHDHSIRNEMKPGITGLAQVKGLHGARADYQVIFSRYQWDSFYVRNAGFWMDIRILKRTVLLFLTQRWPICK